MTTPIDRLTAALAGRYEIEREIGQGGMATVYLAVDARHHRKVAVKVLHPDLSALLGSERFLKEIELTANLQHPHILPLFDSGDADGLLYYVMPYVEGESLRRRLEREQQLPIADALRITAEVADALDYAHKRGVVHRDVKPENVLLHDGRPLVADFGIALAVQHAGGARMTQTGMSLGTPQYMAPEQAMGDKSVDHRADIYALGAVTYEMLSGEPPFAGPNSQAIIARLLTEEPRSLARHRHTIPSHVERAVLTALEKLPADRFATAADFRRALQRGEDEPIASMAAPRTTPLARRRPSPQAVPWIVTAIVALLAVWGWSQAALKSPEHAPSRLALIAPDLGGTGGTALQRQIALTPDGRNVIFVSGSADGAYRLMRHDIAGVDAVPIPQTHGMGSPVVSPDGRWLVGGSDARGPFRVSIEGGSVSQLPAAVGNAQAVAWGKDGVLWFHTPGGTGTMLAKVGFNNSVEAQVAQKRVEDFALQQVLPDGRTALMLRKRTGFAAGPAFLFDLESGEETPLIDLQIVELRYTKGHIVYALGDGTLHAVPFNARRGRLQGSAVPIATGVSLTGSGIAQFAVAANGTVAYIPEEPRSLVFVDRRGTVRRATEERRNFHAPQFSPDGRRIAIDFTAADGRDVWILALDDGTLSRATFERDGHDATWTPDGRFITYSSARRPALGIFRKPPGGAEPPESLFAAVSVAYTGVWVHDGSALIITAAGTRPNSRSDIAILRRGGRGPLEPIVASQFEESFAVPSPDGRWIAFVSDQSGQPEVYVRAMTSGADHIRVSLTGGVEPVWSRDGRELFYRGNIRNAPEMIATRVQTRPQFSVLERRALFPLPDMLGSVPHANYDISPDGQTFVMVQRSPATRVMVIQNLPALVQRFRGP